MAKNIEGKDDKRMDSYQEEFDYLISAGIALEVRAISQPSYPLKKTKVNNKFVSNYFFIITYFVYQRTFPTIAKTICQYIKKNLS